MEFVIMRPGRRNGKLLELKKKLDELNIGPVFIYSKPRHDESDLKPIPKELIDSIYDYWGIKSTDPDTARGSVERNHYLQYVYQMEIEPFKDAEPVWPTENLARDCRLWGIDVVKKAEYERVVLAKFEE